MLILVWFIAACTSVANAADFQGEIHQIESSDISEQPAMVCCGRDIHAWYTPVDSAMHEPTDDQSTAFTPHNHRVQGMGLTP